MRPREDLMEKLAAADPLRDAEQLSPAEQGHADALLARLLATPVDDDARERGARRRRPRRWALVATGALCSALAALGAVDLLDSDTPGPGVVEKAVAAVTQGGAVYHVLERSHVTPIGPQEVGPLRLYFEYWHTTGGRLHRKTFAVDGPRRGKLLEDMAGRRRTGRRGGPVLSWHARSNTIHAMGFAIGPSPTGAPNLDPYADPGTRLRMLERQGRLRLAGTTRVGDRRAYRLVSGAVPSKIKGQEVSTEFVVDAESYLPLTQRQSVRYGSGEGVDFFTRYLVYERLPLNRRTRDALDLDPHPGAKCAPSFEGKRKPEPVGFPNPCAPRTVR
jgi:hypothetical protein